MTSCQDHPAGAELEQLRDGFGAALRAERIGAGLTQQRLADDVDLSKRAIQYFESGARRPRSDTIRVLAHALRDQSSAEDLAAQLCILAGDSLRHPVRGTKRRDRALTQ